MKLAQMALILSSITLLSACTPRQSVNLPKAIGGDVIPDGLYSWTKHSVSYEGDGLLYARYLDDRIINEKGFILLERKRQQQKIKFDPGMTGFTIALGAKTYSVKSSEVRVDKLYKGDNTDDYVKIINFEMEPVAAKALSVAPSFRIKWILFEIRPL